MPDMADDLNKMSIELLRLSNAVRKAETEQQPGKRPPLWYLATPYTNYPEGLEIAFVDASRAAGALLRRGELVYSPIAHCHPIAIHARIDLRAHDIWLPFDAGMMRAADGCAVVKMPGWRESFGVGEEIKAFVAAGKPVRYLSWPDLREVGRE